MIFLFSLLVGFSARAEIDPGEVVCANDKACPGYVAWLKTGHSVCTSFLVEEDLIATNRHCVPEELLQEGKDCTGEIRFRFPPTPEYAAETAECDRIVHLSKALGTNTLGPDFAFLRLKQKVSRKIPPFGRGGFRDNTEYRIFRINAESAGSKGTLIESICKANQETVVNPYFTSDRSPLVTFVHCPILSGNSGSPVVSMDGELRGIINSRSEVPTASLAFARGKINSVDSAHGTNFSCLEKDILDSETPGDLCLMPLDEEAREEATKKMIEKKVQAAIKKLETKVNDTTKKLLTMDRAFFAWRPVREKKGAADDKSYLMSVKFVPLCLVPQVRRIEDSREKLKSTPVTFHVETPLISFHEGMDDNLKFRVEIRETPLKQDVRLTPKDLLQRRGVSVEFASSGGADFRAQKLDLCSDLTSVK